MPIRVLVVDDSAFMRRALSGIIESDAELELVGTAYDGRNFLEKLDQLKPDVVTLDVEMPNLDGVAALKELMSSREDPPAVLMCSSLTKEGSRVALEALQHGAADVIAKPTTAFGLQESPDAKLMLDKIRGLARHKSRFRGRATQRRAPAPPAAGSQAAAPIAKRPVRTFADVASLRPRDVGCVVVGSSTGGPPALELMLKELPADLSAPIVVAQHMPPMFTQSLASRLDALTSLTVVHAETGMPLLPGTVYIGQGGKHVRIARVGAGRCRIETTEVPQEALYKPSVNVLFETASEVYGQRVLGVMLTGMGEDGLEGSRRLVDAGGTLIGQDEESSVVYGMPRAVHDAGLTTAQFAPAEVGRAVRHIVRGQQAAPAQARPTTQTGAGPASPRGSAA